MSILKFSAGPSAAAGIKYFGLEVDKAGRDKCVAWSNNLGLEGKDQVARAWDLTRQEFENEGGREYYHASYNLDPNDSKSREISNDTLLKIGSELAERLAPGHDYACFVHRDKDQTKQQAKDAIFEWIEVFYNRERLHSSIGYKTPVAYEEEIMLAV